MLHSLGTVGSLLSVCLKWSLMARACHPRTQGDQKFKVVLSCSDFQPGLRYARPFLKGKNDSWVVQVGDSQ